MEGTDGGWVCGVSHGGCAVDMGVKGGDRGPMLQGVVGIMRGLFHGAYAVGVYHGDRP